MKTSMETNFIGVLSPLLSSKLKLKKLSDRRQLKTRGSNSKMLHVTKHYGMVPAQSCFESFEITVDTIFQDAITNATSEDRTMLDSHT
jgi:hypothetical protein